MGSVRVEQAGPNLWGIFWSENDKVIENYVAAKEEPKVRVTNNNVGSVILLDQRDREVGRYDVIWVGKEPPCEHIGDE